MVITEELRSKIGELAREYKLSLVILFGSQVTGHTHKESDIDIGYISDEKIDIDKSYEITLKLSEIFKNNNIEFVDINNVSPVHKKQISENGVVLFEIDSNIYDYYKIYSIREYMDTKILRDYREVYLNSFIEKHAK